MNFWMILLAAQAIVAVFALLRESGKYVRFEGEKVTYRS
jgi:hypothetical protein